MPGLGSTFANGQRAERHQPRRREQPANDARGRGCEVDPHHVPSFRHLDAEEPVRARYEVPFAYFGRNSSSFPNFADQGSVATICSIAAWSSDTGIRPRTVRCSAERASASAAKMAVRPGPSQRCRSASEVNSAVAPRT